MLRAQFARQRVEVEITDCAEQDCVRLARDFEGSGRKRMAVFAIGCAADIGMLKVKPELKGIENAHGFACDLRADPVAGQKSDGGHLCGR